MGGPAVVLVFQRGSAARVRAADALAVQRGTKSPRAQVPCTNVRGATARRVGVAGEAR
ncbi:hypothetical protein [Streptomyces sp. Ru73]|uniref:hypothetical protein n=1 Tax=Streptomyces sp. Ru73 TaxID=2080748 RepID=UPI0015E2E523|nr:hypothetical protein [Streptomyces sp. Ru73]